MIAPRLAALLPALLLAGNAPADEANITIYSDGFGLVSEDRSVQLEKGLQEIHFEGVSALIEPSSVLFQADGVALLEQNYEYDLVDGNALLRRYLDQPITVTLKEGGELVSGTLLSYSNDLVLGTDDGIVSLARGSWQGIRYPELPDGLRTRPALKWLLNTRRAGEKDLRVTYTTRGLGWQAEYVCLLNEDDSGMEMAGWVNLSNNTGMAWEEAGLQLVAGELNRAPAMGPQPENLRMMTADAEYSKGGFQEESFFEYHLYTLPRKVDLANNQDKEIALFEPAETRVEKRYVYDSRRDHQGVQTRLLFENREGQAPGVALPEGKVRLYKADSAGRRQLVGEDRIAHTPRDEKVELTAGRAFDLVVERVQKDHRQFGRGWESDLEFKVRNRKEEGRVTLYLDEHAWGDWDIVRCSHPVEKEDARTARVQVEVAAGLEEVVTLTLRGNR